MSPEDTTLRAPMVPCFLDRVPSLSTMTGYLDYLATRMGLACSHPEDDLRELPEDLATDSVSGIPIDSYPPGPPRSPQCSSHDPV